MFPPAFLAPGVQKSAHLLASPDSGEMVFYEMLAFLTCLPMTIVADTCVVDQGGTNTLCSSMARSQCESSNGLCKWEETQASTFLNSAKCLCSTKSCLDKEDGLSSCTLLKTKADCANLGGNLDCLWWDPNQCSSENGLWMGRFGCTSQSACDGTNGKWCEGSCTEDDLRKLFSGVFGDSQWLEERLDLATGGKGMCFEDCYAATYMYELGGTTCVGSDPDTKNEAYYANEGLCKQLAGCTWKEQGCNSRCRSDANTWHMDLLLIGLLCGLRWL